MNPYIKVTFIHAGMYTNDHQPKQRVIKLLITEWEKTDEEPGL